MKRTLSALSTTLAVGVAISATLAAGKPADAFTLSIDPSFGSTENTGAQALLNFNFVDTGSGVRLDLGLLNTTDGSAGLGATRATLVGVGFDLLNGVTVSSYSSGSSGFTQLWTGGSASLSGRTQDGQSLGSFDVGISPPRNSFNGGNPQAGLTAGSSTLVSFLLGGANLNASALEASFLQGFSSGDLRVAGRFQQVNAGGGSDKVLGGVVKGGNSEAVPEPSTILGVAAAGAAFMGRKKLARKAEKA